MKGLTPIFTIALLVIATGSYAQGDKKDQPGKKELKSGLMTFQSSTDENGAVSYGFKMDGRAAGPNMLLHADGSTTYQNYNKKSEIDGVVINMKKQDGSIELYTYRKSKKNGPAFKVTNGKVAWNEQYKNDIVDINGFVVKPPGQYASIRGDGKSGFSMEKDDEHKSYSLGYFMYGYRHSPMILVWDKGSSYYGQYLFGNRVGFGVMFYDDGRKYVGYWDDGYKNGLGFMMDKDGNVTEKGDYKGGRLITPL